MKSDRTAGWRRWVAASTGVAILVVACAEAEPETDPGAGNGAPENGAPSEAIAFEMWDHQTTNVGLNATIEELLAQFADEFPHVTVNRRSEPFEDYNTSLRLAATGDDPPSIFEAGQGFTVMGPLVRAGALLPLDAHAEQYGWWDRYGAGATRQLRFTPDGEGFGDGNLYGISTWGELVGFFYNRRILEDVDVAVPTTLEEFEQALATLHAAGEVPIMIGNLEQWPASMMYAAVQNAYGDRDELRDYIFGEGSFDTSANLRAAEKVQEWVEAGYFNDGFQGLSYSDSITEFLDGTGAFLAAGGSWLTAQVEEGMGENGGFLLPPPAAGNRAWGATGSFSTPWVISSQADHPDVIAALIDLLTGEAAVEASLANSSIPAFGLDAGMIPDRDSPFTEILRAWLDVTDEDALVYFLDWPAPGGYDTTTAALGELFGLQVTPEQFVAGIEAWYRDEVGG